MYKVRRGYWISVLKYSTWLRLPSFNMPLAIGWKIWFSFSCSNFHESNWIIIVFFSYFLIGRLLYIVNLHRVSPIHRLALLCSTSSTPVAQWWRRRNERMLLVGDRDWVYGWQNLLSRTPVWTSKTPSRCYIPLDMRNIWQIVQWSG